MNNQGMDIGTSAGKSFLRYLDLTRSLMFRSLRRGEINTHLLLSPSPNMVFHTKIKALSFAWEILTYLPPFHLLLKRSEVSS